MALSYRSKRISLKVTAVILSPLSLLTALLVIGAVNPMGIVFLTEFTVVNRTATDLWVTPIGAIDMRGRRATLPFRHSRRLYLPLAQDHDFHISPGATRRFVYDWDDIQFTEILVRRRDGPHRLVATGLPATEGQFSNPPQTLFVITNPETLPRAGAVHMAALRSGRTGRVFGIYALALVGLMPPVLFWLARRYVT